MRQEKKISKWRCYDSELSASTWHSYIDKRDENYTVCLDFTKPDIGA